MNKTSHAYLTEDKVWGEVTHSLTPDAMTSILRVNAGFRCSSHCHVHRWNQFQVIHGKIRILVGKKSPLDTFVETYQTILGPNMMVQISPGDYHRFEVIESGVIVETYWTMPGQDLSMHDIVRLDEGGRIG